MPNFDPAQPLPGDDVPVTVPVSPNQIGAFVGTPSDIAAQQARDQAAAVAGQTAYQQQVAASPVAANAPPSVVPQPLPAPPPGVPAAPVSAAVPPAAPPPPPTAPEAPATSAPATPPPVATSPHAPKPPAQTPPAAPDAFAAVAQKEHDAAVQAGTDEATAAQNAADARAINTQREVDRQRKDAADRAEFQKKIDQVQKSYADDKYQGFKLSPGRSVLASLGILLGGASYDPHHVNQSIGIYEDAVKSDFAKWQANHETLYKNLQQTLDEGKQLSSDQLNRAADARLADAAKLDAVIEQGKAFAAKSKNALAVATLDKSNSQLAFERDKAQDEAKRLWLTARSGAAKNYAEAAAARAKATADKTAAAEAKEIAPISKDFDKVEARLNGSSRSPGLITKWQDVRELGNNLRAAVASKDPQAVVAAAIQAKEKISRLNTGAAPSAHVLEFLDSLTGDPQHASEKVAKLLGNPKASEQTIGGLLKLVDQSDESALKQIDLEQAKANFRYNAPKIGIAKTPAQRDHVQARMGSAFGQVTTRTPQGEVPRYQLGGASPAPGPASTPAPQKLTADQIKSIKAIPATDPDYARAQALLKSQGL